MKKIFVAMSGGVDSSVAAALLKERGFDVRGIHMSMWRDPSLPCTAKEDRVDAARAAAKIGVPFETWDFTEEYRKAVVDYMVREYAAGRTPNPDIMCNRHIKFGAFLKRALAEGADYVATGHYVRLSTNYESSTNLRITNSFIRKFVHSQPIRNSLTIARDKNKDQSYFLWTSTQKQLKHCLFPIGEHTKPEVRGMARKFGLPTAEKPDSQGVCFIGEFDIREFLQRHISVKPGRVVTSDGKVVGEHEGLSFYTIGERHGLGIGGGIPYYVAQKDFATNTMIVAEGPYDEKLFHKKLVATDVNWISGTPPKFPLRCEARIRYRQPLQKCVVTSIRKFVDSRQIRYSLMARFSEPQRAITPGQSVVFYSGEEMLGGGTIV